MIKSEYTSHMKHSQQSKLMPTVLYMAGVGLVLLGVGTLLFAQDYALLSIAMIVAGCVVFVFIPRNK